jgi:tetratricopeptide (TPR) repeat protein
MHNNLGAAYLKRERYDLARQQFERAIAIDREYLEPYYNLGALLIAFGRYADAIAVLTRGLAIDPHHAPLRRQLGLAVSRLGG